MIASDRQSIFGDTYGGVPNPQIPFQHPYPTRYHGPIFTTPRFGMPFISNPYARAPFSGGESAGSSTAMSYVRGAVGPALAGAVVGAIAGSLAGKKGSKERAGQVAGVVAGVFPALMVGAVVLFFSGAIGGKRG